MNAITGFILTEYTRDVLIFFRLFAVMFTGFRITSIATLIISLQLLFLIILNPDIEVYFSHTISSKLMFITSNDKVLQESDKMSITSLDFQPKDNGGPNYTRGAGTR